MDVIRGRGSGEVGHPESRHSSSLGHNPHRRSYPLAQFQSVSIDPDGIFRMVTSINAGLLNEALSEVTLKRSFDAHWARFEVTVAQIRKAEIRPTTIIRTDRD